MYKRIECKTVIKNRENGITRENMFYISLYNNFTQAYFNS